MKKNNLYFVQTKYGNRYFVCDGVEVGLADRTTAGAWKNWNDNDRHGIWESNLAEQEPTK